MSERNKRTQINADDQGNQRGSFTVKVPSERFDAAAAFGASLFERFGDAEDAYNTACSHSRAGRADEGLAWLERAVEAGYQDLDHLESDEDMAAVRALAGYTLIRDRVTPG